MDKAVENFIPLLHKCVNQVYTTPVLSREDLINEAVIIFMELTPPTVERECTFLYFAELSITGGLRNLLRKSVRSIELSEEEYNQSEEEVYIGDEVHDHADELMNNFRMLLSNKYEKDLFDHITNETSKSIKELVAINNKSMYNVYKKVKIIKTKFHAYVYDNINEDLLQI